MILSPLRRKVLRDLRRLWAQALAIALVLAAGVSTLILGTGASSSLIDTRARFYEEARFADVFASLTRAPEALLGEIAAIDGVLTAEARIRKLALLDMPGMDEPGSVALVSLPPGESALNRLHMRTGSLPDLQATGQVVVSEAFAKAQGLTPGARFSVLMNGQRRELTVVGTALSAEFVYAMGPGEVMPDPRRFGIVWMPEAALAAAYDLEGAFSDVAIKLAPGANEARVIAALDHLLEPYGGSGAVGRKDQLSHAFLEAELNQLQAMTRVLPPVFLVVAAMLVNMTLSRLIALEREQIGLLKAIGYGPAAIAGHYLEFVGLIALIGAAIGCVAGSWLGMGMAQLYARFFAFPYLIFIRDPAIYALATAIALAAGLGGALQAVRRVMRLAPAVAMSPPAPTDYRQRLGSRLARFAPPMRQTARMVARHLTRWPLRTGSTVLGIAMAVAILVASLWTSGSFDYLTDVTFFRSQRQDVTIAFAGALPARATLEVARLPGVMRAEPFRSVAVQVRARNLHRKLSLTGLPETPQVARVLSPALVPMMLPDDGLILSEALATALAVGPGDLVTVDVLEGRRGSVTLPVRGVSLGYLGLSAQIEIGALNRLLDEGQIVSGVNLLLDEGQSAAFFAAVKARPQTGFLAVKALTLAKFKATIAENISIMTTVYLTLASVIAIGVVYNFARIALSEQGRELASLRVLGFTSAEVAGVIFAELAAVVLLAQPLGWGIGYALAQGMVAAFSSDLYRMPLVIGRDIYAIASLVVLAAAAGSALLVRGRINNLDMIEVLKTRE